MDAAASVCFILEQLSVLVCTFVQPVSQLCRIMLLYAVSSASRCKHTTMFHASFRLSLSFRLTVFQTLSQHQAAAACHGMLYMLLQGVLRRLASGCCAQHTFLFVECLTDCMQRGSLHVSCAAGCCGWFGRGLQAVVLTSVCSFTHCVQLRSVAVCFDNVCWRLASSLRSSSSSYLWTSTV
jgi:hypothetical protein